MTGLFFFSLGHTQTLTVHPRWPVTHMVMNSGNDLKRRHPLDRGEGGVQRVGWLRTMGHLGEPLSEGIRQGTAWGGQGQDGPEDRQGNPGGPAGGTHLEGQDWEWEKIQSKARLWVRVGIRVRAWPGPGRVRGKSSARGLPHFPDEGGGLMGAGSSGAGPDWQEARLAHPRPAPHKEIQHVLTHLVMVLVQELVHLQRGNDGAAWAGPGSRWRDSRAPCACLLPSSSLPPSSGSGGPWPCPSRPRSPYLS